MGVQCVSKVNSCVNKKSQTNKSQRSSELSSDTTRTSLGNDGINLPASNLQSKISTEIFVDKLLSQEDKLHTQENYLSDNSCDISQNVTDDEDQPQISKTVNRFIINQQLKEKQHEQKFQNQKNEANKYLKSSINLFDEGKIDYMDFEKRMLEAIKMYDAINVMELQNIGNGLYAIPLLGQIDPKKESSIQKNKAQVYKALIERYENIDQKPIQTTEISLKMQKPFSFIKKMKECLDVALLFGLKSQSEQWYAKVLQQSVFLTENKKFKFYLKKYTCTQKIEIYWYVFDTINESNLETRRRVPWELAYLYLQLSQEALEFNYDYVEAINSLEKAIDLLQNSKLYDDQMKQNKTLQNQNYHNLNLFKTQSQYQSLSNMIESQYLSCKPIPTIDKVKQDLRISISQKKYFETHNTIQYKQYYLKELELETNISTQMCKLYHENFNQNDRALRYLKYALSLCELLKNRSNQYQKFNKKLMSLLNSMEQVVNVKPPVQILTEKTLRIQLKPELDCLQEKKLGGVEYFIKYVTKRYFNWQNQPINLTDDDFKPVNLKKTITKVIFNYHPDRQIQDKLGIYTQKDVYIRQEIVKILNSMLKRQKRLKK